MRGQRGLDERPCLAQVVERQVGTHQVEDECACEGRLARRCNERAVPVPHLDEPTGGERSYRVPDNSPTDPVQQAQLGLRREPAAGLELAADDPATDVYGDPIAKTGGIRTYPPRPRRAGLRPAPHPVAG